MVNDAVTQAIHKLVDAGHLQLSVEDTMRFLGGAQVKQEPLPLAALPWCGVVQQDKCIGITRGRHRLFNQCQGSRSSGDHCKKCAKILETNGALPCGNVHTRMASDPMEYMNAQPFIGVMEQNGWSPEYVKFSVDHHGGTIDERNFVKTPKKSRRGRPSTTTAMAGPPLPVLRPVDEDEGETAPLIIPPAPPPAPTGEDWVSRNLPVAAAEATESEDEDEPEDEPDKITGVTSEQINKMSKTQLAELCTQYNIPTTEGGKVKKVSDIRTELIGRLA